MATENENFWAQIDAKCDEFKLARREDPNLSIDTYVVDDWPIGHRRILFRELLDLELHYRSLAGKPIDVDSYANQFPEFREVVEHCIKHHHRRVNSTTQTSLVERTTLRTHPTMNVSQSDGLTIASLGHYQVSDEIGRGGMGVVYRARDSRLCRDVALKVVLSGEFASSEAIERFLFEAQAAAQLDHPNIVPVFDVGKVSGRHYIAMGLVEGSDLAATISANLYDPRQAAELVLKLTQALQYAHEQGILHRDIKPSNVLLDERGEPRLADFGLAKNLNVESASDLTHTGQTLGTPPYMAPEQANGSLDEFGPCTDIHALGAILYFCTTGGPPFRAASVAETLRQVIHDEPMSPRAINPQVDRDFETICLKCLSKQGKDRYQSCQHLGDDLRRYLDGMPINARPVSGTTRCARWCRRHPARAALIGMALLLGLVTLVTVGYRSEMIAGAIRVEAAEELAQSRRQTAETAQFFRLMHEAAAIKARRDPGWTWKTEALLRQATALPLAARDEQLLRDTIVSCQTSFDLRFDRTLGDQSIGNRDLPGSMAFSPGGQFFAFGQSINEVKPKLYLYETSDFEKPKRTFSFISGPDTIRRRLRGDKKVDNGYRSLAFSPDNRWLAAGTRFGKVLIYDLAADGTSTATHELDVMEDREIKKVAFSFDGSKLYALIPTRRLREWTNFADPVDLDADVEDFAIDPVGRRIAARVEESVDVRTDLRSPVQMRLNGTRPGDLAFSSDGRLLAVSANDGIHQVDPTFGPALHHRLIDSSGAPGVADWQYDGIRLFAAYDQCVRIWQATTGRLLFRTPAEGERIALDPSNAFMAMRNADATQLFRLRAPVARKTLALTEEPHTAAFSGSAVTAHTQHHAGPRAYTVRWNTETGDPIHRWTALDRQGLHAHPSSAQVASAAGMTITNSQPLGLVVLRSDEHDRPITDILTPLGRSISLGVDTIEAEQGSKAVQVERGGDGKRFLVVTPSDDGEATTLRVSVPVGELPADWRRMAVTAVVRITQHANVGEAVSLGSLPKQPTGNPNAWYQWNASEFAGSDMSLVVLLRASRSNFDVQLDAAMKLTQPSALKRIEIHDIVVSPIGSGPDGEPGNPFNLDTPRIGSDGKTVWGVLDDEIVCSWDLGKMTIRSRWDHPPPWLMHIYDMEIRQKWVYTCGRNGAVQMTDVKSGRLKKQLQVSAKAVNNIDVSQDESWMIVSGEAGHIDIRALPDGRLLERIADGEVRVTAQTLSRDERWLVTGDAAGNCVLMQRRGDTFERVFAFDAFNHPIRHLALSEDGRFLSVLVVRQNAVHLFDLHTLNHAFARYGAASHLE